LTALEGMRWCRLPQHNKYLFCLDFTVYLPVYS
jgi:hypothetical protein